LADVLNLVDPLVVDLPAPSDLSADSQVGPAGHLVGSAVGLRLDLLVGTPVGHPTARSVVPAGILVGTPVAHSVIGLGVPAVVRMDEEEAADLTRRSLADRV
jgi:hypothetical protein